jgi:choline-sulfatase
VAQVRAFPAGRPFYLQATFSGPHAPYDPPTSFLAVTPYEEVDDFITPADQPLTVAEKRALWKNRQHYRAMIACIDHWVGKLLDVLEDRGMIDNTLVIFTSDHGEMLGDHRLYNKQMPYKESARIPLIIRWPGVNRARRHDGMVELTDVSATLLDAAGLDPQQALDTPGLSFHGRIPGRSLRGIVTGENSQSVRDCAFSTGEGMWSMVETTRWKLVRWVRDTVAGTPREELFDLENDPGELLDRSADPACREVVLDLRERLLRVLETTPPCQMTHRWSDPA